MDVELLDCTLRDGGYINDWEFGNSIIKYVLQRYVKAGIKYVEIGFLDDRREFDINRTIFPTTSALNKVFDGVERGKTKLFAMIDYGTCNLDNIDRQESTVIAGIRLIFKKKNMYNAIEYASHLMEKGYLVNLNMVSITSYEDQDILDFCKAVNEINPFGVAIVDTYGLMHKEGMQHYFELLNYNLNSDVAIGYHSHNNFQLAYSNTIELLNMKTTRRIILDGSAYGMGKSAGNTPIELLAMHLNEGYGKKYDINQILEIIDTVIMPIYRKNPWGYGLKFYLAAANNCHPNYISYLLEKCTLSIESINNIVKNIQPEKKLNYDDEYIKLLYSEFQGISFDDRDDVVEITCKYHNKNVLLIGPGKTISTEEKSILEYIKSNDVVVISINFIPQNVPIDVAFIGNPKRYGMISEQLTKVREKVEIIGTSNISPLNDEFDYLINTERLIDKREYVVDNSFVMLLNLLSIIEPSRVVLAGLDGYNLDSIRDSYCNESFTLSDNFIRLTKVNEMIKDKIKELKTSMDITFLTPSRYEENL